MKFRNILCLSVLIGLIFLVGGYFLSSHYHQKIRVSPVTYIYEGFSGSVNSALIIQDYDYKNEIIEYYNIVEKNPKATPKIKFPLKTLPQYEIAYVLDFSNDSSLVEIVSYYNRGAFDGGGYLRGWVDKRTLHPNKPENIFYN